MPTNMGDGGALRVVQRGVTTFTATSTTVTISSVATGRAYPRIISVKNNGGNEAEAVRATLTNATTLELTKAGGTQSVSVAWEVVELVSVKSLQLISASTTAGAGSTTNFTISSVNMSKTQLFASYIGSAAIYCPSTQTITLTSATNVQAVNGTASALLNYIYVVEFL